MSSRIERLLALHLLTTFDVPRGRQAELLALAGLTPLEIADLMETTSVQVEKWLKGRRIPSAEMFERGWKKAKPRVIQTIRRSLNSPSVILRAFAKKGRSERKKEEK